MRRIAILTVLTVLVAVPLTRADVTLRFDPDVLIQAFPAAAGDEDIAGENKATQIDARRVHQPWGTVYETFYNPAAPQPQPGSYNTYMNWRDSLGAGEGLAMFNSWFLDNPLARSWGETVVMKPGTSASATAADGWNFRIIDSPYGLGGQSVQWWTLDPSKRINTVSDIGAFSITADLYYDDDGIAGWSAGDTPLAAGDVVRMWAGCLNGDDPEFYRDDTQAIYFDDQGWGTRSALSGPWAADGSTASGDQGTGFESALTLTAIPAPGAALLGAIGLGALAGFRRRLS